MSSAFKLRSAAYALAAWSAATCLSTAHADIVVQPDDGTTTFPGPFADPFFPSGDLAAESTVGSKALSGARWTLAGFTLDQANIVGVFLSGTTATSGAFPNCLFQSTPPWVATLKRDGVQVWRGDGNVWMNIQPISSGGSRCGLSFNFNKGSANEVLPPGRYEFRISQPATGADVVASVTIPACAASSTVYSARHDGITDNFYTIDSSEWQTARNTHGYVDKGVPFKLSKKNELTAPFKRYFKGLPQLEHFYSHLGGDESVVFANGYVYERIEGHIFPTALTGTIGLHRLAKFAGATGDLQHVYTTSVAEANTYQSQGWVTDGVKGFVCAANSGSKLLEAGGSLSGGGEQSAVIGSPFPAPLTVAVRDQAGNPVPNATVAFALPESGASAVLSAATATTGIDGNASVTATANTVNGAYFVTATAAGAGNVTNFTLTNTGCSGTGYTYESAALTGTNTWGPDMTFADGTVATFSFTVPAGGSGRMQVLHHSAYTTYPLPDTMVMSISTCKGDFEVPSQCKTTSGQYVEVPFSTVSTSPACQVQPGVTYYMNIKQTACYYGSSGICGLKGYRTN